MKKMAKRFIDTNLFSDEWFSALSVDTKLFFIYFITTCDHAGILRLNRKLCEFQTGIKSSESSMKELGESLITLKEGLMFMPKFLKFQYPGFPRSKVMQQQGALRILATLGVTIEQIQSHLRVNGELTESYDSDSVDENGDVKPPKKIFIAPTLEEFKKYFIDSGFMPEVGERAWRGYDVANWEKANGKKVRNWKQTCQQVWFKEDNRIKTNGFGEIESGFLKKYPHLKQNG